MNINQLSAISNFKHYTAKTNINKNQNIVFEGKASGLKTAIVTLPLVLASLGISANTNTTQTTDSVVIENTRSAKVKAFTGEEFKRAREYYNSLAQWSPERQKVTYTTYEKGQDLLYKMEKDYDQAFINCETYSDIILPRPRWPWRRRDITDFNIVEMKQRLEEDMEALNELKDTLQIIFENANGEETHTAPERIEYDFDKMAKDKLGMPFEQFVEQNGTYYASGNPNEAYVKAKSYVNAMTDFVRDQAYLVRWDSGEDLQNETSKYLDNMYGISDMEYTGITDEALNGITSGIMKRAFEAALIEQFSTVGIDSTTVDRTKIGKYYDKNKKQTYIFTPNGKKYDISGKEVK